mmetsp:Transcript_63504/g.171342  ORF Transcript_63504/g.171342 Transcript_63504/m.171342 type:complete len:226 (+) Transcript_63504:507-1184(+)
MVLVRVVLPGVSIVRKPAPPSLPGPGTAAGPARGKVPEFVRRTHCFLRLARRPRSFAWTFFVSTTKIGNMCQCSEPEIGGCAQVLHVSRLHPPAPVAVILPLQQVDELRDRLEVPDVGEPQVVCEACPVSHGVPVLPVERRERVQFVRQVAAAVALEVGAGRVVLIDEEGQCFRSGHVYGDGHGIEFIEPELTQGVGEEHRSKKLRERSVAHFLLCGQGGRLLEG